MTEVVKARALHLQEAYSSRMYKSETLRNAIKVDKFKLKKDHLVELSKELKSFGHNADSEQVANQITVRIVFLQVEFFRLLMILLFLKKRKESILRMMNSKKLLLAEIK